MFRESENNLLLKPFQSSVTLDYGELIAGRSKSLFLNLINDFDEDQIVVVDKFPTEAFTKFNDNNLLDEDVFCVMSNSKFKLEITWSPKIVGNMYEKICFKVGAVQLQVKCVGKSKEPKAIKKIKGKSKIKRIPDDKENDEPINYNIQKEKISQSNYDYPTTTSNEVQLFYDEKWLQKQEERFVICLNNIFTSNQKATHVDDIILRRQEIQKSAKELYNSDHISAVVKKMEKEMLKDPIKLKSELLFRASTIHHNHLMEYLLKYNNIWLQIGLETIFNKPINALPHDDNYEKVIRQFIDERFLWSSVIARKFMMKKNSLFSKPAFEIELNRHIILKYCILVYFLDRAKCNDNILPSDIFLFKKNSKVNSSNDMIGIFTGAFVSGEGNIIRRLIGWGCVFEYYQSSLADYDFTVTNLASDLCDGIRLAQLAKLLLNKDLMSKLRYPALDLHRKTHNVQLAINAFIESGTNLITYDGEPIDSSQITWSHREKTLALLWCILSHHYIDAVVDRDRLMNEIFGLNFYYNCLEYQTQISNLSTENQLIEWVKVVCLLYNLNVSNLNDLRDGRGLCYLLNHYFPHVIQLRDIKNQIKSRILTEKNSDSNMCDAEENLVLFFNKLKEIGGAPVLISSDNCKQPSNNILLSIIAFFSCRIDLMIAVKAAIVIQRKWRIYRQHYKCLTHYIKYLPQLILIQSVIRKFVATRKYKRQKYLIIFCQRQVRCFLAVKRYGKLKYMTLLIQTNVRRFLAVIYWRRLRQSTIVIQTNYRMIKQQKTYQYTLKSIIKLQSYFRMKLCFNKYHQIKRATAVIQRNVKSYLTQKSYSCLKRATIMLQTQFRCTRDRNHYRKLKCAAIILQSYVRKFIQQKKFNSLKKAALTIQKLFRQLIVEREVKARRKKAIGVLENWFTSCLMRKRYVRIKLSTICLQKYTRMYLASRKYHGMRDSCIVIQKYYRRYRDSCVYKRIYSAIIIIQKYCRGYSVKMQYQETKRSIVCLQKHCRGWLARKSYKEIIHSAIVIRKTYLKYRERKRFLLMKKSAIKIQSEFRRYLAEKSFVQTVKSIVFLQSHTRKYLAHTKFQTIRKSIIIIQKNIRCFQERHRFINYRNQIITIQSIIRKKYAQKRYCLIKRSIILIQSQFRKVLARKKYLLIKHSSIIIQKYIRRYIVQRNFQLLMKSAIVLQKNYRSLKCHREFLRMKSASICIQTFVRKYLAQIHYRMDLRNIINVQSNVKCFLYRKRFCKLKQTVIVIQKWVRGYLAKKKYMDLRTSVMLIQKNVKRMVYQKYYRNMKRASGIIQKNWKCYKECKRFKQIKKSTIIIQTNFRGYLIRKQLKLLNNSALIIQKNYRRFIERQKYLCKIKAAITIQKNIKRFIVKSQYIRQKNGIINLQSCIRRFIVERQYQNLRKSTIVLQSYCRRYIAMKSYKIHRNSIIKIQSIVRRYLCQKRYTKLKYACVVLEKNIVMYQQRRRFISMKQSAIVIQSQFKSFKARQDYLNLRSATIVMQKNWRRWLVEKRYQQIRLAAIKLQSWIKMIFSKRQYNQRKIACICIQKNYRKYKERKKFIRTKNEIVKLQSWFRMIPVKMKYHQLLRSIVRVQSIVRTNICVRKFRNLQYNVITIQKYIRCYLQKKQYQIKYEAIIKIQSFFRCIKDRNRFIVQKKSVVLIQSHFRGVMVRQQFLAQKSYVIKLQSVARQYLAKKSVERKIQSIRFIQAQIRGFLIRVKFRCLKKSVIKLQSYVRMWRTQKQYEIKINLSKNIGRICRGFLTRKYFQVNKIQLREKRIKMLETREQSVLILQTQWRRFRCRKYFLEVKLAIEHIQLWWRNIFNKRIKAAKIIQEKWRQHKRFRAARVIQRIWRGTQTRNLLDNQSSIGLSLIRVRQRFLQAQAGFSTHNTMRCIGARAWKELQMKTKPISGILQINEPLNVTLSVISIANCLLALDKVTRLSREMCWWLANECAIYNLLVNLIHCCNRGEADLQIVALSISILINLGRAKVLNLSLVAPEVGNLLLKLLRNNVHACKGARGVTVFCQSSLLLLLLIQTQNKSIKKKTIKSTDNTYKLASDKDIKFHVSEMQRSLHKRWENTKNHYFSQQIMDELKLSPYWDLSRNKQAPVSIESLLMKRSRSQGTVTTSNNRPGPIKSEFKKPLMKAPMSKIRKPKKPILPDYGSTGSLDHLSMKYLRPVKRLSVSSSGSTQSSGQVGANDKDHKSVFISASVLSNQILTNNSNSKDFNNKPNTWDLTHKLYAICLLYNVLDF